MSNVFFNGLLATMSSGILPGVYAAIGRVQSVKVDYQIPRGNTTVLGRFKPLDDRTVVNYTPVNLSIDYIKGDKTVETCLGILNSTGFATLIGNGTKLTDWGCRTYPVILAPIQSPFNQGEYDVISGVLKSFQLQGTINDVVKGAFTVEGLDLRQSPNGAARVGVPLYSGAPIRGQDMVLTGIDFTGLGFSGLIVQSFTFNAALGYASEFRLGEKYPTRRVIEGNATLNLSAYIDGTTNTATGLGSYDQGGYLSGSYVFTLTPSCVGNQSPTTITLTNPYLESQTLGLEVGTFIQTTLVFSIPLTIVAAEANGYRAGSNVSIT